MKHAPDLNLSDNVVALYKIDAMLGREQFTHLAAVLRGERFNLDGVEVYPPYRLDLEDRLQALVASPDEVFAASLFLSAYLAAGGHAGNCHGFDIGYAEDAVKLMREWIGPATSPAGHEGG